MNALNAKRTMIALLSIPAVFVAIKIVCAVAALNTILGS